MLSQPSLIWWPRSLESSPNSYALHADNWGGAPDLKADEWAALNISVVIISGGMRELQNGSRTF